MFNKIQIVIYEVESGMWLGQHQETQSTKKYLSVIVLKMRGKQHISDRSFQFRMPTWGKRSSEQSGFKEAVQFVQGVGF